MIFKTKKFILLLLILFLIGCNQNEQQENKFQENQKIQEINYEEMVQKGEQIKYEEDESIKEVSIENFNKDLLKEKAKILEDKEKYPVYIELLEEYQSKISPDEFKEEYKSLFLNEKGEFKKFNKNQDIYYDIDWKDEKYDGFDVLNRKISKVRELIFQEPQYKEIDRLMKEFIEALSAQRQVMKEIKKYYASEEYKKDNFEKGKLLNNEYLGKTEITENKFNEIRLLNRNIDYEVLKKAVKYFKEVEGKILTADMLRINVLFQMLEDKFLESKVYIEKSNKFITKSSDKNQYVNELKSIQKTLRIVLKKLQTAEKEQINKEKLHIVKYENILREIQKISNISALAIKKMEEEKNNEANEIILIYLTKSGLTIIDIEALLGFYDE